METLLDDYKRKLLTAERMIKEYENDERLMNTETLIRITTKAAEYRSFIVDIERALARTSNENGALPIPVVITPLLTDDEIEEYIWEEISIPLSQIDIDTQSDGYIKYLNAVHWAKWGRDNCNGL